MKQHTIVVVVALVSLISLLAFGFDKKYTTPQEIFLCRAMTATCTRCFPKEVLTEKESMP